MSENKQLADEMQELTIILHENKEYMQQRLLDMTERAEVGLKTYY